MFKSSVGDRCSTLHKKLKHYVYRMSHWVILTLSLSVCVCMCLYACVSMCLCVYMLNVCVYARVCIPYSQGCKLGEASEFLVPMDARIQVPTRSAQAGCYEVCTCGHSGRLEGCADMPCLDTTKTCVVGGQRKSEC